MRLVEATDAHYAWMLRDGPAPAGAPRLCAGGVASDAVLGLLRGIAGGLRAAGAGGALAWFMVVQDEAVGLIGLKSAPEEAEVDFGYGVAPVHEGRGHTTRAVARFVAAMAARGVRTLTAETAVHNRGSQRVLEKNGFVVDGERIDDEDGPLLRWRLVLDKVGD